MIDIKLDTHAVRQIFPEGTAARAQLQQSVINNIVKEMVIKDSDNTLKKAITAEIALQTARVPDVKIEVQTELNKLFERKGYGYGYKARDQLHREMETAAKELASQKVNEMINEVIEEAMKKAERRIQDSMDIASHKIQQILVEGLNKHFGTLLEDAIAHRIKDIFPGLANGKA